MVFQLIDKKLRKAFSDASAQYDMLAGMHKEIGKDLLKKIPADRELRAALDVGMGTGTMAYRLGFFHPETTVIGIDIADGMVDKARAKYDNLKIVQADAHHLPFQDGVFDCVLSNLAFQWMGRLEQTFSECRRVLSPGGDFIFTLFGRNTFQELFDAIDHAFAEKDRTARDNQRLPDLPDVQRAMSSAGWGRMEADYEKIVVHFPDVASLLRWIRDIGANYLSSHIFLGKESFQELERYYESAYRERFGLRVTLEILWVQTSK